MVSYWYFALGGIAAGAVMLAAIFIFSIKSWKIPVVSFKLVGDKRRPVLDLSRKAKILIRDGVKYLKFRGTPELWEMRNFKNEDYYLTLNGQPALVVFEFAKDCFAPVKPSLFKRKKGEMVEKKIPCFTPIDFKLEEEVMRGLLMKAVDDFDPDFVVRNFARIDRQFTGGIKAFLREFGWILGWIMLFIMALVGIILFFQKSPELAAACANAATQGAQNIVEAAAANLGGPAA